MQLDMNLTIQCIYSEARVAVIYCSLCFYCHQTFLKNILYVSDELCSLFPLSHQSMSVKEPHYQGMCSIIGSK